MAQMRRPDREGTLSPYEAALKNDWESFKEFYNEQNIFGLFLPLSAANDTAFHLAVFSGSKEPLQHLINIAINHCEIEEFLQTKNSYGNTALHEAAANGNLEAVKVLVDISSKFVEVENISGVTPLFRAAAYGKTKVMRFLASRPGQKTDDELKDCHRQKKNIKKERDASILHVAIQGEHFGTALELLNLDKHLANLKDSNGMTALHHLANKPSAFKSGHRMGGWRRLVYYCLPIGNDHDDDFDCNDDEGASNLQKVLKAINLAIRGFFFRGWPILREIWLQKRKHEFAYQVTLELIKEDTSWMENIDPQTMLSAFEFAEDAEQGSDQSQPSSSSKPTQVPIPLFKATENGITEIVNEILKEDPKSVEYINDEKQNILHVAIMQRQKEIFDQLKKMKIPMSRLVRRIDKNGYTILHHAAKRKQTNEEAHIGPAYELQDELKWYKRVKKIMPSHYAMGQEKLSGENLTCKELFNKEHDQLLRDAREWIKETSQSCSAVAVLVATVVFAAAYTVPGGSNEHGLPIFLNSSLFLVFTVTDVVALASSLTSVVIFLSILTSPYKYENFLYSLPQKLTLAFTFLFLSLATTMLAFAATIVLIIRLQKRQWTTTLIYTAAFLPVSIFALTQFPIFVAFAVTVSRSFKMIKKTFPFNIVIGCVSDIYRQLHKTMRSINRKFDKKAEAEARQA